MSSVYIRDQINEHRQLVDLLGSVENELVKAIDGVIFSLNSGGKLMLCGNGGSAADSQHIAAELTGRFVRDRQPLAAISLNTDVSAITSIANDYSYADVFSRQVGALGRAGDCLIGISTSGNSKNVINAINAANERCVYTIGLLGGDGGLAKSCCQTAIIVPSRVTARVQEMHILIGHILCGAVEDSIFYQTSA